jgi:hypothetical protein
VCPIVNFIDPIFEPIFSSANFAPKMSVLELYSNIDENFNILKGYWDNCLNPGSETGGI